MTFRTKSGEEISWDEYLKRWKKGISEVTPLQQTSLQINSTWIIVFGLLAGIVISALNYKTLWWLLIILLGGLGNTLVQLYGLWQKKNMLQKFEVYSEEGEEELEENINNETQMKGGVYDEHFEG